MKFAGTVYLTKEIVLEIHQAQLEEHGGSDGIRDHGGLESAIAQPRATFDGEELHPTIFDKAAAYAFYIAEAQAFVDGNKRVALVCALTFLALNNYEIPNDQPDFYDAMINIAKKDLGLDGLSNTFRNAWIRLNVPEQK